MFDGFWIDLGWILMDFGSISAGFGSILMDFGWISEIWMDCERF